jgi:hypothetical protein
MAQFWALCATEEKRDPTRLDTFQTVSEGKFSETRTAPVLLTQVLPDRTPLYRTGYQQYSPSFRYPPFSETELPEMPILGNSATQEEPGWLDPGSWATSSDLCQDRIN